MLVAAIATSGYMLGYASGHTTQSANEIAVQPETTAPASAPTATGTPAKSAINGGNDAQSSAPPDQSLKTFWEAYGILKNEYYGEIQKFISPAELNTLLPKFLGTETATDLFTGGPTNAEEVAYFSALFQRDSSIFTATNPSPSIFQYDHCKIGLQVLPQLSRELWKYAC